MSPADAAYWMTDNKAADDGADGWVSDVVGGGRCGYSQCISLSATTNSGQYAPATTDPNLEGKFNRNQSQTLRSPGSVNPNCHYFLYKQYLK